MNTITEKKYTRDGGNAQRIFIKDAQVGWKAIIKYPNRHLGGGVAPQPTRRAGTQTT